MLVCTQCAPISAILQNVALTCGNVETAGMQNNLEEAEQRAEAGRNLKDTDGNRNEGVTCRTTYSPICGLWSNIYRCVTCRTTHRVIAEQHIGGCVFEEEKGRSRDVQDSDKKRVPNYINIAKIPMDL